MNESNAEISSAYCQAQKGNHMGKVFFTGDLHFGHENVIAFDNRPFSTVDEMDEELIKRWNAKVGKGDLVYVKSC